MRAILLALVLVLLAAVPSFGQTFHEKKPYPTLFPRSRPPAKQLAHLDLVDKPIETRFMYTVLQGLVNRRQPRILITQNIFWHGHSQVGQWIDNLKKLGYRVEERQPDSVLQEYRGTLAGAVLYEDDLWQHPERLCAVNTITLLCAIRNAVPVTESMNRELKLPVIFDARNRWKTNLEATRWAFENLWDHSNHFLLAHTHPTSLVLRDYLVANRVFSFYITPEVTAADMPLFDKILDGTAPNSPVMGCWGGYGEKPAGKLGEPDLTRWLSERAKFMVVTDGCFNLSVHSGMEMPARSFVQKPARRIELESDKVYLCFNFTDGDNLQYIQGYFPSGQWWGNPGRGKVPISWTLNPSILDLMPDIAAALYSQATEQDEFTGSTAGMGIAVAPLYGAKLGKDGDRALTDYLALTGEYMTRAGMGILHTGDTSGIPWSRENLERFAAGIPGLQGIMADYSPAPGINAENANFLSRSGVPVLRAVISPGGSMSDEKLAELIASQVRGATPKIKPGFIVVIQTNWFTNPNAIRLAMEKLGPGYVAVRPSEFARLYREGGNP